MNIANHLQSYAKSAAPAVGEVEAAGKDARAAVEKSSLPRGAGPAYKVELSSNEAAGE